MNTDTATLAHRAEHALQPHTLRGARFDARGCPVSTRSQAAIEHAEQAQRAMVSFQGDPLAPLDAAIAADPGWALPHVIKANLLLTMSEHGPAELARACLAQAVTLAGRANDRERAHMAATHQCLQGQWLAAADAWERLLLDHPQDLLALFSAHVFDFYRGDARNLQRRVSRVLPQWSPAAPLYSFVLGMHAFGLEENNHYGAALDAGHAALALERRDAWAVHAVTHVHEMRGEHETGADFLRSRCDDWAPDNGLAYHNWWHLALFQLERCDTDAALALLDERVLPAAQTALPQIDATAMLWRLHLLGVDLGVRWQSLADAWATEAPAAGYYAFNDMHAMLAQIGAGRLQAAEAILAAVRQRSDEASVPGRIAAQVGVPLLRGLLAYGEGRHDEAVESLWAVRDGCHRLGGSHAQRDLVDLTLLDAAVRAGQKGLARRLLNERLLAKADSPLTAHWARRIG